MAKQKYEMKTERSQKMNEEGLLQPAELFWRLTCSFLLPLLEKPAMPGIFLNFFIFFRSFLDLPPTVTFRIKVTKAL